MSRDLLLGLFQAVLSIIAAPLLLGWVDQCRAWLQNRGGAGVLQPYRVLRKLMRKDAVIAYAASPSPWPGSSPKNTRRWRSATPMTCPSPICGVRRPF